MIIGYTAGVFDLFHSGHVNLLKAAKSLCDKLVVGVSSDEIALYKNKKPIIKFQERKVVVESCRYVDCVLLSHFAGSKFLDSLMSKIV